MVKPDCVAGHSFGEFVALHAAGVLDEAGLIRLARRRGELMNEAAAKPGAMLAIGGEGGRDAAAFLDGYEGRRWIANHNGPTQVTLSGETDAISELETRLGAQGVPVRSGLPLHQGGVEYRLGRRDGGRPRRTYHALDTRRWLVHRSRRHRRGAAIGPAVGAGPVRRRVPAHGRGRGTRPRARALRQPAHCVVLSREVDPLRPLCGLAVFDSDSTPLVEVLGLNLVRRPDSAHKHRHTTGIGG